MSRRYNRWRYSSKKKVDSQGSILSVNLVDSTVHGGIHTGDINIQPATSAFPKTPPENIPHSHVIKFVGRSNELDNLHQELQKAERVAISVASVTGMGGIGKTELALQYALKFRENHYPGGICWLQARDIDLMVTELLKYGRVQLNLKIPEDIVEEEEKIAYCWRNWPFSGDILIVFDDVTS
ncbi:MAG: ATP-binding protein, partial [Moorea sp. SIO3C2]|nr:ATP-binding protein [Moorena sp. SIO3C2]